MTDRIIRLLMCSKLNNQKGGGKATVNQELQWQTLYWLFPSRVMA